MLNTLDVPIILGFKNYKRSNKFDFKAWIATLWTKSPYSHVKIMIGDKWYEATLNGIKIYENEGSKYLEDPEYDYITLPNTTLLEYQYDLITEFELSIKDAKYDWMSIFFSHFIRFGIDHNSKWTCSELVTKLLQLCSVKEVISLRPERTSPQELFEIFNKD